MELTAKRSLYQQVLFNERIFFPSLRYIQKYYLLKTNANRDENNNVYYRRTAMITLFATIVRSHRYGGSEMALKNME